MAETVTQPNRRFSQLSCQNCGDRISDHLAGRCLFSPTTLLLYPYVCEWLSKSRVTVWCFECDHEFGVSTDDPPKHCPQCKTPFCARADWVYRGTDPL